MSQDLKSVIEAAWEARDTINTATTGQVRDAVHETIELLDAGRVRVAQRDADGTWTTNQWAKQAILLFFRLTANRLIDADAPHPYWDKVPLKFTGWDAQRFEAACKRLGLNERRYSLDASKFHPPPPVRGQLSLF